MWKQEIKLKKKFNVGKSIPFNFFKLNKKVSFRQNLIRSKVVSFMVFLVKLKTEVS